MAQLELIPTAVVADDGQRWFMVLRKVGLVGPRLDARTETGAEDEARRLCKGSKDVYQGSLVPDLTRWNARWSLAKMPEGTPHLSRAAMSVFRRLGHDMDEVRRYADRFDRPEVLELFPEEWR